MPAYLGSDLPDKTLVTGYLRELTERLLRDGYVYSDENGRKNVGYDYGLLLYNLTVYHLPGADTACEKLLSLRDEVGVWSEYYDEDRFAGSRYRPWESAINLCGILRWLEWAQK